MKKLICPHKVILPSFLNGAIFNLFCSGLIFDFLTKCNVPSLDGSVAAGAALGVQLDPALLAHGVTVHTLPDAHRGPHLLNTVNKTYNICEDGKTSKQMGHSNSDFQNAASISYWGWSLSQLFSCSFRSIFFSNSFILFREYIWSSCSF